MRVWGAILTAGMLGTVVAGCSMLGSAEGEPIEMPTPDAQALPPGAMTAADEGYEAALAAFDDERYAEAQDILGRIISVIPDRYDARLLLG